MPIQLPNSQIVSSRLGFGCAHLVAGFELRRSVRLVDLALEHGYRHFDVAPTYGMGTAEYVVGRALGPRRATVTIASKVGIAPHSELGLRMKMLRAITKPVRQALPKFSRTAGASIFKKRSSQRFDFTPEAVERSLQESLRRLKTDYLDILFMHEAGPEDITDELFSCLDRMRRGGVVRAFGIASSRDKASECLRRWGAHFDIAQTSWCVFDTADLWLASNTFHITHSAISRAHDKIKALCRASPFARQCLCDSVGFDLFVENRLAQVLLGYSIARNVSGITLVATHHESRIGVNFCSDSEEFIGAGLRLASSLLKIRRQNLCGISVT